MITLLVLSQLVSECAENPESVSERVSKCALSPE